MDKTSMILGWLTGRAIAGHGARWGKVPVAYRYNGVRLPALPEWDQITYPYAVIVTPQSGGNYRLYINEDPFPLYVYDDGSMGLRVLAYDGFELIDGAWVEKSNRGRVVFVWSNHDIIRENADADPDIFYASDPVPVYE